MRCGSCTIHIGSEFIEQQGYRYGGIIICGRCKDMMIKHGHIRLDGGTDNRFRWLYPDGSTKQVKLYLKPEIHFKILSA